MSKAKFILKEPSSKTDSLIYMVYNYQYKRFKFSTGEKINPKFWNLKTQRAKESKKFLEYPEFNSRLNKIENGINNVFRRLLNDGIQPNNILLKKHLIAELSGNILKPKQKTLFEFIDEFIEECKLNKQKSTITVYKTVFKYLQEYAESKNKNIDFESITLEFYNSYVAYLTFDSNLSSNTVGKHIKTLKTFLNEATERGYNTNLEFKKKKFKVTKEESDTIYLSMAELKEIENIDFADNPRLDKIRDLFLIGCYTGLRFSDFIQIKPENIITEKSILQIRTQKTGQRVSIPLHSTVNKILKKYNYELPRPKTNQVMNSYLKEVASEAKLNNKVETTITKGGVIKKESIEKYNLVTTHTARRSFATNLFLADVPTVSIMKITGHKTEKSFLRYIRVTQEQNADKLLNHPFFN
ncbi:tyrosine-type recombinase/integrase [Maribacter stanieri]|uniref:tyrosine-type recombinase/integrase n=1 Tax=Maribacter stanieri TaxID=440514 RepID=UPI0024954CD3|nr:site-specific integrase [Maribacter stanieri]